MLLSKQKKGVLFLHRESFEFYTLSLPNILSFNFPVNVVSDLEITSKEKLNSQIRLFVENNNIPAGGLVMILTEDTYFQKDFPVTDDFQKKETDKQNFLDNVPFERMTAKVFKLKEGERLIATNKEFWAGVADAFEDLGFTVETVVPATVLNIGVPIKEGITVATAQLILNKADNLRQYSFIVDKKRVTGKPRTEAVRGEEEKPTRLNIGKNLILLLVALFVLIVLLVFLTIKSSATPSANQSSNQSVAKNSAPAAKISLLPTAPASHTTPKESQITSAENIDNIKIKLLRNVESENQAELIKEKLATIGFSAVEIEEEIGNIDTANTLVLFSSSFPNPMRSLITQEVNKDFPGVSIQETNKTEFDVTIVLGR